MGYIPDKALSSQEYASNAHGSILTLARLDAFVATVIFCLREDRSDNVGGHRQKLYNDTFGSFLPIAYNQLIGVIAAYVKEWCPEELSASFLSTSSLRSAASTEREATREVFVPSINRRLIAVSSKWFRQFISEELGEICDCYVAEFDPSTKLVSLLGTAQGEHSVSL